MRSWIAFLALSGLIGFAASGGCSDDSDSASSGAPVTIGSGVGGGNNFGCNGNGPDGFCNLRGNNPESCNCPDCAQAVTCRGVCPDDGQCVYNPDAEANDEDCSCDDCYGKVGSCPPFPVGCPDDDDPSCTANEDCTCPDCTGTARCTGSCVNNGSCVEYLEGCSCADCAAQAERCGGNPTTTSSSSSGGGNGNGGSGGAGTGAGGASGTGGAGGA